MIYYIAILESKKLESLLLGSIFDQFFIKILKLMSMAILST